MRVDDAVFIILFNMSGVWCGVVKQEFVSGAWCEGDSGVIPIPSSYNLFHGTAVSLSTNREVVNCPLENLYILHQIVVIVK